jgi:hypothetical protein
LSRIRLAMMPRSSQGKGAIGSGQGYAGPGCPLAFLIGQSAP